MKKTVIIILVTLVSSFSFAQKSSAPNHNNWDELLKKHVTKEGKVNYKGIKSDVSFKEYLKTLSNSSPNKSWSVNERLSFWINAYNAFTIELILKNYPTKSIKNIKDPWDQKFIKIGGKTMSLNTIEHEILRKKFNEPRIHFAIVCASESCPKLLNQAFLPVTLAKQLDSQARSFINDPTKNKISVNSLELSLIFKWFKGDFTKKGSLNQFINKYWRNKAIISTKAKTSYLKYDWSLNE